MSTKHARVRNILKDSLVSFTKKKLFFIAKNIPLKFSTFLKNNTTISVQALKAI